MYIRNPQPGFLDQNGCIKAQNDVAVEFNKQLKDTVTLLKEQLPQASLTYVDLYSAKYGLISNAKNQGDNYQHKLDVYKYIHTHARTLTRHTSLLEPICSPIILIPYP